jgi:hypothetical protein
MGHRSGQEKKHLKLELVITQLETSDEDSPTVRQLGNLEIGSDNTRAAPSSELTITNGHVSDL